MNKKKIITVCACFLLLFAVVGITYAAFNFTNTGSDNTITSGKINFSYTEPSNSYTIENAMPTYDSDGKVSTDYFEFVISSNATTNSDDDIGVSLPFEISIESVSVDTGKTALDNDEVKVYLTSVTSGTEKEELAPTLISGLADSSYSGKILFSGTHNYKNNISAISTTYRLRAWIDSDVDVSSWSASFSYQYKFKINVNSNAGSQQESIIKVTAGQDCDIDDIGCEVEIGTEHFYVIGDDTDNSGNVKLLAKYNLKVGRNAFILDTEELCTNEGYEWDSTYNNCSTNIVYENISDTDIDYNMQSEETRGYYCRGTVTQVAGYEECSIPYEVSGAVPFSTTSKNYWSSGDEYDKTIPLNSSYGTSFPAYVYDNNSSIYSYIETYVDNLDVDVSFARLLSSTEAVSLGCSTDDFLCTSSDYDWLLNTSFWLGDATSNIEIKSIFSFNLFSAFYYQLDYYFGVRPVISVSKTLFN